VYLPSAGKAPLLFAFFILTLITHRGPTLQKKSSRFVDPVQRLRTGVQRCSSMPCCNGSSHLKIIWREDCCRCPRLEAVPKFQHRRQRLEGAVQIRGPKWAAAEDNAWLYVHKNGKTIPAYQPAKDRGRETRQHENSRSTKSNGLDGFANRGHEDNDVSTWTHGISGNVFKNTGKIATFEDGFKMKGGFFYVADYGYLID
jgi:hypothetical protein